jgi:chemotaxis protein CheZ
MGEPRKVFRIEERVAARPAQWSAEAPSPDRYGELMAEVNALRVMLAASAADSRQSGDIGTQQYAETARLTSELNRIAGTIVAAKDARAASMTRIAQELNTVVSSSEQATQKILAAAEEIDQVANNLSAALKGKIERDLAQDIRDLVIKIFEACNFQDLAGQRITKVMTALDVIEHHIAGVLEEFKNTAIAAREGSHVLHGPRLDIDCGHVSQDEIDAMFEG